MNTLQVKIPRRSLSLAVAVAASLLGASSSPAQLALDTTSRESSRVFFKAIYPASESSPSAWSGNVANGNAGNTTPYFKQQEFLRINFFRAFAGVPAQVSEAPNYSSAAQQAALMMSANHSLDHTPPPSWTFYTAAGADAAGKSNLAYGSNGSESISQYMEEAGSSNQAVGHRRWILYPQTQQMGTGDISANNGYAATNALWIFDTNHYSDSRPAVRCQFVAWPPQGYVPYQFVYPRWSFSYPNADFSGASVTMQRNGSGVPVRIDSVDQGYGENSIVFIPDNLDPNSWNPSPPNGDTTTTVNVNNVVVDGTPQSFSYNVTSFNPNQPGNDTPPFYVEGPDYPTAGANNEYRVADQVLATGYQWKYSRKQSFSINDGAEIAGAVSPSGYIVRDKLVRSTGKFSYHLANPRFTKANFALRVPILCSASTVLRFDSRLTYATRSQAAKVEVSTDNGQQWTAIWTQRGNNRAGEGRFIKRSVSLAGYAGREVRVRFNYDLSPGSVFTQTSKGIGWYVDNVVLQNAERLLETSESGVSASPSYSINPASGTSYAIQVRPLILGGYFLDWSPVKIVTAAN